MAQTVKKIKRSRASLTGGFVVGIAVICLTMLIGKELGWQDQSRWAASLILGGVMGAWVRIADL